MHFGTHCGVALTLKVLIIMFKWIHGLLFLLIFSVTNTWCTSEIVPNLEPSINSTVGSWTFSGLVNNESGDKYGYFFAIQRQGLDFSTKAALIDEQTNRLVFFYESTNKIEQLTPFDWNVGYSFMRFNPINDSWVFGVKTADKKGFNFKVDMLNQANKTNEALILSPGISLQALQTSQLNGHLRIDDKEQFVTGNKAWFGKIIVNKEQKEPHELRTTFCRLYDENSFYSAKLKEKNASGLSVSGWFDPLGNKVKMSQNISINPLNNEQCILSVALPKLNLKLVNALKTNNPPKSVAGFSKGARNSFCFVTEQSFLKNKG